MFISRVCLNEGDLVDLLERGEAAADALERRLAQEAHAFLAGQLANFGGGLLFQDDFADGVGQVQQLVDGGSAAEAGSTALDAAGAFAEAEAAPLGGVKAAGDAERSSS